MARELWKNYDDKLVLQTLGEYEIGVPTVYIKKDRNLPAEWQLFSSILNRSWYAQPLASKEHFQKPELSLQYSYCWLSLSFIFKKVKHP